MSILTQIKAALLGSLIVMPSVVRAEVSSDPNCWRADETAAARFEDFRLKILVGALNCKNYLPVAATSYNSFLQAKKELVLANMYVVRAHFAREAGASEGADNFANYETLAGNRYSSPTYDRAKCETVDASARLAASMTDADLIKLVDVLSPGALPSGCKLPPRPATPALIVAVVAPPPVVAPAASAVAVPATNPPLTDAQRIAASNVATRELLASRAVARAQPAAVTTAVIPVAVTASPATIDLATVPIPATLVAEAKPVAPPALIVAPVPTTTAPAKAIQSPNAAMALAEAAKALAVAAAALGQSTS